MQIILWKTGLGLGGQVPRPSCEDIQVSWGTWLGLAGVKYLQCFAATSLTAEKQDMFIYYINICLYAIEIGFYFSDMYYLYQRIFLDCRMLHIDFDTNEYLKIFVSRKWYEHIFVSRKLYEHIFVSRKRWEQISKYIHIKIYHINEYLYRKLYEYIWIFFTPATPGKRWLTEHLIILA